MKKKSAERLVKAFEIFAWVYGISAIIVILIALWAGGH